MVIVNFHCPTRSSCTVRQLKEVISIFTSSSSSLIFIIFIIIIVILLKVIFFGTKRKIWFTQKYSNFFHAIYQTPFVSLLWPFNLYHRGIKFNSLASQSNFIDLGAIFFKSVSPTNSEIGAYFCGFSPLLRPKFNWVSGNTALPFVVLIFVFIIINGLPRIYSNFKF